MPRACSHCSAALPDFADAHCPNCHAELPPELRLLPPVPPAPPAPPTLQAPSALEFVRSLRALTPSLTVAPVVLLLNVLAFIVMTASGADATNPKSSDLVNWGANFGPQTLDGDWWRLLTSAFVHGGALHLALNVLVLAGIGPLVERLLGGAAFALVYLASALGGGLASLLWNPEQVSAGASTAVLGAFGAVLGVLLVQRHSVPPAGGALLALSGLGIFGYNLALWLLLPSADFAAHAGGLAFGFVLGALVSCPLTPEGAARRRARAFVGAWVAVVLVAGFGLLVASLHVSAKAAQLELERFMQLEPRVLRSYDEAVVKLLRGEIQEAAYVDLMAREILPEWREQRERLEPFARASGALGAHIVAVVEYMRLRERAWEELVAAGRTKDAVRAKRGHAFWQQADEAAGRIGPPRRGN